MNKYLKSLLDHVRGVTVSHRSPFSSIPTPKLKAQLSQDIIEKWVNPCYLRRPSHPDFVAHLQENSSIITKSLVKGLLYDFNWRSRKVGAIFAAHKGYAEFIEIIGNHLLKSEVCYAGKSYALALAYFGGSTSKQFLCDYLDYYLTRTDLHFDQEAVLSALRYIEPAIADSYRAAWDKFAEGKSCDLEKAYSNITADIEALRN